MDFQRLLLDVGKALSKDEALAFLCTDLLGRSLTSVESASDLFSRLMDQDYLSPESPQLLKELLNTVGRTRLVRELSLADQESTRISPYRKLLYNLSQEITDDDLKNVKFLLNKTLPRRKLEENVTTLEVFLEMEHMDLLSDTNLNELEKIIQSICPMLKEKITEFKALQVHHTSLITQETGRPRSMSYDFSLFQPTRSLDQETRASREFPGLQPLAESFRNSSNTSLDYPDVLQSGGECGALPRRLSDLSTETSGFPSMKVRNDALEIQSLESPSGEEMFQTTNTSSEIIWSYPMASAKRGICLIINNHNFKTSPLILKNREGTMTDESCLQDVFRWLGFETVVNRDCSSDMMLSLLQNLGRKDHSQMDCVVCCILSHGQKGSVYGIDGQTVELTQLKEPLNGLKCSSLAEKPKLFFIQACQGNSEQKAVYIESDGDTSGVIESDAVAVKDSIPSDADYLMAMSTVPSFVSYRERTNGSWFIQSLCQNLVQMVPSGYDLVSILTKVNADVSKKTDALGIKKQMPQPAFTLRKKVVFPIPKAPAPRLPSI
uniref:Caspase-8 n=1 Tax=Channa striata TaxID=64152 RepID=T1RRM8_CHASR|nr:caspase 10 [Channa striata]